MRWSDYPKMFDSLTPNDLHKAQLAQAIALNDISQLNDFLDNGDGIDLVDDHGNTLLHEAVARKQMEVLDFLLNIEGAPIDAEEEQWKRTPLIAAVADGNENLARILIEKGADVNLVDIFESSALHYTFHRRLRDTAKLLLEKGADINIRSEYGATCLYIACMEHWVEGVCMLLYYGADVSIPTIAGYTPFHIATDEIQEILFDHIFDGQKVPVQLCTLTNLMKDDSPLLPKFFDNISEVCYDTQDLHNMLSSDIFILNSYYLKLTIELFDYAVKDMIHYCHIEDLFKFRFIYRLSLKNLKVILDSHLASDLIKEVNKWNTAKESTGLQFEHISNVEQQVLISKMLKLGLSITFDDAAIVFVKFGFCSLFREMIQIEIGRPRRKKHLMPFLIYDPQANIEDFLATPEEYYVESLDLVLNHFSNPKFNMFCLKLGEFEEKVKKVPQVPLLLELSRNAARRYIADLYQVTNFRQFSHVLQKLPVSEEHQRILTYERQLYPYV